MNRYVGMYCVKWRILVNNGLRNMWKEAIVAYFKLMCQDLVGGTE
jgi:hypothetical protein